MTEVQLDPSQIGHIAGKVAIVTGGASGIGKAIVDLLVQKGAIVYFCDLNVGAGNAVATHYGQNVRFVKADVSKWDELSAFFAFVKHYAGQIDQVYANTGYVQKTTIWDDVVDENGKLAAPDLSTMDVTLTGTLYTAKLALYHFKNNPKPGGSLVFTASSSSYNERPNLPLYSVSKHGVLALLRSLHSLGPAGNFHVAGVAPGPVGPTNMVTETIMKRMDDVGMHVQGVDYIAMALVILASDPARNGHMLHLVGGRAFEIEGKVRETMPLWYGEYGTEQALKGVSVNFAGASQS